MTIILDPSNSCKREMVRMLVKTILTVCKTYLCMLAVIRQIRILLVATALIVLRSMSFPVAQAHPAEIMSAGATLHVIAATIFLNANLALRAILQA